MANLRRVRVLAGLFSLFSTVIRFRTPERHIVSGSTTRRHVGRKASVGVLTVFAVILATCGSAFANAANPLPDSHGEATLISGTVTKNADGTYHVDTGSVVVDVGGTWNWGTKSGSSEQDSCEDRYGVGWAVDWSGISSVETVAGQSGSWEIDPPKGSPKGTPGKWFHVFGTDMRTEPPGAPGNVYTFTDPCQQFDEDGFPEGPWSAQHTYTAGQTIPSNLCVSMYDLHGTPGHLNDPAKEVNPAENGDNSVKTNDFDPTVNGQYCFTPVILNAPEISTTATPTASLNSPISDTATLTGASAGAVGTITFKAWNNATCAGTPAFTSTPVTVAGNGTYGPVSFTPVATGTYNWIASYSGDASNAAVSGECGDEGETSVVDAPVQTLSAHVYDCTNGPTTTEVPGGIFDVDGPTILGRRFDRLALLLVLAGQYQLNVTAPTGFKFVDCGSGATLLGDPPINATKGVVVPSGGSVSVNFYVTLIPEPPVQTLAAHIYDCTTGPTTTEVPNGTLSAAGPSSVASQANPFDLEVNAGQYVVSAGAPAGFKFVDCGSGATLLGNPPVNATLGANVPSGGSGSTIFYVAPIPPPPVQTLTGHIYDCSTTASTTEVPGGTLSAAGPSTVAQTGNPLSVTNINAGDYLVTAGAPPNSHFVDCGSGATINSPTNATLGANVPSGGTGSAIFYVAPNELPPISIIVGHIYDCTTVATTTEVNGGTLSAAGPTTIASQPNPLGLGPVGAGQYLMSAGAPAGHHFVACGSGATLLGNPPVNATLGVTVPLGGIGTGIFYVAPDEEPPVQTLTGHIYDCTTVATTTEVPGGTLSASGPSTVAGQANPLNVTNINAGQYLVSAGAPTGFKFVDCGSGATLLGNPPLNATKGVTVPSGGTADAVFYVAPIPPPPVQTLAGHIYLCTNGTTPSTTEVSGGTIAAGGPTTVATQPNPLAPKSVAAGEYLVAGGAPAGYEFVECGGEITAEATVIGTPATTATQDVTVPSGGSGTAVFYVVPIPPPPVQTLVGHIYDCSSAATTDEVLNGTLSASGPTPLASQPNPLSNNTVAAGQYVVTAGAPAGHHFVDCGSGATINSPTNATLGANVPSGGTGMAIFYVEPDEPEIPILSVTVAKTNDGNDDGTFTDDETGRTGDDVDFRALITNNSAVPVTITSLSDIWPGASAISPACAVQVVGVTLASFGGHVTCDFTVADYVPTKEDGAKVNTVTVEVCEDAQSENCDTDDDTTTVHGDIPPLNVTVAKTNDGNNDGTFTDDETGITGNDVDFRAVITNNSNVDVVITSISDVWPGASAITPDCEAAVVGETLAANGGSVTCDFTVADYVPTKEDGAKINTVTVEVCEDSHPDNCDTPDDTTTVRGDIPPLNVTVAKTNDGNDDGTFTDDETGRSGDDVDFRAVITNNSTVDVIINSISDEWPGAAAITPECAVQVVGVTLAANGGSVTCDFTVADYVPTKDDGAKVNTVTVEVCDTTNPDNCDTPDDTTTVHGDVPPLTVTVAKTNDGNGDGTFTDDETGAAGSDVNFRAVITNNSNVDVVINSISDEWPGAAAITPECADAVIGETLAANGGSVTCDFIVEDYVPPSSDGAKVNTVTVEVCEDSHPDNCDTPDDTTTVRGGAVVSATVVKTNDANGNGTYEDDEIGTAGGDVKFRATITNNSAVPVVVKSISDIWPGSPAIAPACAAQVIGVTLAPGGSVTCDFTVTGYVPPANSGAKVNTVTVVVCEDTHPENCGSDDDTTTVRGTEVLPAVFTPLAETLPRTGAPNTTGLLVAGFGLLVLGLGLLLTGGQLSGSALALRLSSSTTTVTPPCPPVIDRNLAQSDDAAARRASGAWSATTARRWGTFTGR